MTNLVSKLPWNRASVLPWVILFFAALNVIFLGGKRRAFGSFVAEMRRDYPNITLTELNWIGDSYAAVGYMTSGISIAIILFFKRRYGMFQFMGAIWVLVSCVTSSFVPNPHWLFLTHTLFHGIGSSLIISTVGLVVNDHFDSKHPYHILATTLVSGGSVASIIFVTLFASLIQSYGWRYAFIILGCLYFIVNASAALFFRKSNNQVEDTNKKTVSCRCEGHIKIIHIPLLCLWFIDRVMTSVVTYGLLLNLTDYMYRTEKNLVRSTTLTTLFASGEAITYLIGATITAITRDFFKDKLRYILLGTSFAMSICLIALEYFKGIISVCYILCFLAGFTLGPSITFLFPAGEELTRLPGHMAYPISLAGMGFGMLVSPLLTAKIAEIFLYKWFFFVQGCLILIKVASILAIILILHFYDDKFQPESYSKFNNSNEVPIEENPKKESTFLLNEGNKKK
uniref:Slc16a-2 n=1 Tax=Schmidtea mediterranea TaxID=79327 RepID=A0A0H3YF92_SCHMD|nr:slc16a-2 [Schmidtea mediterranea]